MRNTIQQVRTTTQGVAECLMIVNWDVWLRKSKLQQLYNPLYIRFPIRNGVSQQQPTADTNYLPYCCTVPSFCSPHYLRIFFISGLIPHWALFHGNCNMCWRFFPEKIHIAHSSFLSVVPSIKSALWAPFWLVPRQKTFEMKVPREEKSHYRGKPRRMPAAGPSVCDPKSASGFMGRMGLYRPGGFRQTHSCNPVFTGGPVAGVSWEGVTVLG